jgi:hypothetical protein
VRALVPPNHSVTMRTRPLASSSLESTSSSPRLPMRMALWLLDSQRLGPRVSNASPVGCSSSRHSKVWLKRRAAWDGCSATTATASVIVASVSNCCARPHGPATVRLSSSLVSCTVRFSTASCPKHATGSNRRLHKVRPKPRGSSCCFRPSARFGVADGPA